MGVKRRQRMTEDEIAKAECLDEFYDMWPPSYWMGRVPLADDGTFGSDRPMKDRRDDDGRWYWRGKWRCE